MGSLLQVFRYSELNYNLVDYTKINQKHIDFDAYMTDLLGEGVGFESSFVLFLPTDSLHRGMVPGKDL